MSMENIVISDRGKPKEMRVPGTPHLPKLGPFLGPIGIFNIIFFKFALHRSPCSAINYFFLFFCLWTWVKRVLLAEV